jgi:hypothetical protein
MYASCWPCLLLPHDARPSHHPVTANHAVWVSIPNTPTRSTHVLSLSLHHYHHRIQATDVSLSSDESSHPKGTRAPAIGSSNGSLLRVCGPTGSGKTLLLQVRNSALHVLTPYGVHTVSVPLVCSRTGPIHTACTCYLMPLRPTYRMPFKARLLHRSVASIRDSVFPPTTTRS